LKANLKNIALRWTFLVIVFLLIEIYAFQAFKSVFKKNWILKFYFIINVLIIFNLLYRFIKIYNNSLNFSDVFYNYLSIPFAFFITLLGFKLIVISFLFIEDITRITHFIFNFIFPSNESNKFLTQRRSFISKIALIIAALPIPFVIHGIYRGRHNYRVLNYELEFNDLPEEFDGYKITHISDIHSGSLQKINKVEYAVDLINKQNSDLVLFTGDFVNNKATELNKWKKIFSKIVAKDGKFSVLGNHDYGDYVNWKSDQEKKENFKTLLNSQKEMGFKLLLNESVNIKSLNQSISLVGVENWGKGGFRKNGDIDKACVGLRNEDFKVVMSHDPSHWDQILLNHQTHFHLTLSGHTHGMQFGIEIPGWIKWSPVKWVYKHWAGIYYEKNQYINVNRGFGVLGFPGRVGVWPEISVITLKKT
jgi:predicted MPP superfamily phosphohydrolase|tara:strand:+ start:8105 stop:9364 length:1260 start_codon:yes stop_codon:yes gene_type:complete